MPDRLPVTAQQPHPLQPVERRIDGPGPQLQRPTTAFLHRRDDRVPVQGPRLDHREQQPVQMSPYRIVPHT
ncbi:hypothetical protein SFR_3750 [Streptomyces sp. FR-008]|nr:hypothetical protein SFR_3750 [Streptomyces sp. FR-008]